MEVKSYSLHNSCEFIAVSVILKLMFEDCSSRYKWFPSSAHRMSGFGVPPTRRPADGGNEGRHQWGGGGNRLGD